MLANASTDLLGAKLLQAGPLTWAAVERAVPPIRVSGRGGEWGTNCKGVRTFVGSRGAAYDGTLDDLGHLIPGHDWDGCSAVRQIDTIAIHGHNAAVHEPEQTYDEEGTADGLVGGILPTAVFYLPMRPNGKHPGFGFVQMATRDGAAAAIKTLNETLLLGRTMAVDSALSKDEYSRKAGEAEAAEAEAAEDEGSEEEGEELSLIHI